MNQTELESIRSTLVHHREAVERHLAEHGVSGGNVHVDVDEGFADSAQATAERAEVLSLIEQLQAQQREIDEALERIAGGSYGKCEKCGEAIPVERLEAIPTARLCVRCKQASGH